MDIFTADIFTTDTICQMSAGERAALDGVLEQLRPALSLAINVDEAESLERLAIRSGELHSFDREDPPSSAPQAGNVTIHTGDPCALLQPELQTFAEAKRNVDFVLVGGERSPKGLRKGVEDLLDSGALGSTVVLIYGTTNEEVRAELDSVHYAAWPKVAHVDLDFIPGQMPRDEPRHALRGGLGAVIVDSTRLAYTAQPVMQSRYHPAASLLAQARKSVIERERESAASDEDEHDDAPMAQEDRLLRHIGELESEILRLASVSAHHERLWREMMASVSWSVTAPIRWLAGLVRRLVGK